MLQGIQEFLQKIVAGWNFVREINGDESNLAKIH